MTTYPNERESTGRLSFLREFFPANFFVHTRACKSRYEREWVI
jgi:hypothetical protein